MTDQSLAISRRVFQKEPFAFILMKIFAQKSEGDWPTCTYSVRFNHVATTTPVSDHYTMLHLNSWSSWSPDCENVLYYWLLLLALQYSIQVLLTLLAEWTISLSPKRYWYLLLGAKRAESRLQIQFDEPRMLLYYNRKHSNMSRLSRRSSVYVVDRRCTERKWVNFTHDSHMKARTTYWITIGCITDNTVIEYESATMGTPVPCTTN